MPVPADGLILGDDGKLRCFWHGNDPEYLRYHDEEWGTPLSGDEQLFEKICLEGFQSGLSWLTILRKRDNFRRAFDDFDLRKIALYNDNDVERLVKDAGIIRHRGKITSTINNASRAIELIEEYGTLKAYFWQYEPTAKQRPKKYDYKTLSSLGKTEQSTAMSKDLKKRGWSFVGPTTCYAFMQSMGIVNDHIEGCCCRPITEKRRRAFKG